MRDSDPCILAAPELEAQNGAAVAVEGLTGEALGDDLRAWT